jgi:hypothetical protein
MKAGSEAMMPRHAGPVDALNYNWVAQRPKPGAICSVKHMASWLRDGLIIVIVEVGIK